MVIARTCRSYVVFASFAGPTGDVFTETAGSSAIWSPDGLAIARARPGRRRQRRGNAHPLGRRRVRGCPEPAGGTF